MLKLLTSVLYSYATAVTGFVQPVDLPAEQFALSIGGPVWATPAGPVFAAAPKKGDWKCGIESFPVAIWFEKAKVEQAFRLAAECRRKRDCCVGRDASPHYPKTYIDGPPWPICFGGRSDLMEYPFQLDGSLYCKGPPGEYRIVAHLDDADATKDELVGLVWHPFETSGKFAQCRQWT